MLMLYAQIGVFAFIALTLSFWFTELHARNRLSWETIAIRLQSSTGASSPRTLFKSAGVMLQAVDYLERRTTCSDIQSLESLRRDALALRMTSALAILGIAHRGFAHKSR